MLESAPFEIRLEPVLEGGGPAAVAAPSEADLALSEQIMRYWIDFATDGNPNGEGLPEWPAFTNDDQCVMVLGTNPGAKPVPNREELEAWDGYFEMRRKPPDALCFIFRRG